MTRRFGKSTERGAMIRLRLRQFEILIADDPVYSIDSVDNPRSYDRAYRLDEEPCTPTSLHGVRVVSSEAGAEIASCILASAGGASGVHEHSAIVNGDSLVIAVGPYLVALRLPTLELVWKTGVDDATCFGVYHSSMNRCYISHGELNIASISYGGRIAWTNSGADIFTEGFKLSDDRVTAIDWNDEVYVWEIGTGEPVTIPPNQENNLNG